MSATSPELPVIVIDGVAGESLPGTEIVKTGVNSQTSAVIDETRPETQAVTIGEPASPTKVTLEVPCSEANHVEPATQGGAKGNSKKSVRIVSLKKKRRHHSTEEDLNHLTDDKLILAETLIRDAEGGRNFQFKTDPVHVRSYIYYHKWYLRWLLYFFIFLNLCLAFMEKPTRQGWEKPYWATMMIEFVIILFFIARVLHSYHFSISEIFWRDTKNIMVIGTILLTILDIFCYIIWINAAPDSNPVRWSRPLRSLLIINFSDGRQIRRAFRNIRRTVPEIMNVLILFILGVFLFALLALKLFGRRNHLTYPDGQSYFKNYFDSIWDLYVLVTTANNPDVMMPAYDESKWFAIFFIIFIIICLYVFMSIVLAAIYNNYRTNLKNEIKHAVFGKRKKLREAFELLKVIRNQTEMITRPIWKAIMKRVLPKKSTEQIELLMKILDSDSSGYITKRDFLNLVNLLEVPVSAVQERQTFIEKIIPAIYTSKISRVVRAFVRTRIFRYSFDFLIFVNAWFIGFDIDMADWFFLSIFMVEIILKLYVFGPKEFFKRFWNTFDFFVITAAFIATAIEGLVGDGTGDELSTLDLLLVLRVMRLIKIFGSIKRFKVILMTIVNIGPSIATYGGVIFVLYYMFAIVGMEIFHGLVNYYGYNNTNPSQQFCGNPKLNGTAFYHFHYCNNNFNDILRAFVVLTELTVVNQWHVISSGFVFVTNKGARLYFFLFHLSCVVIVLNIFIAFVLEAFILEYSIQKTGRLESVVESKIKELGLGIGQVAKKQEIHVPEVDEIGLVPNEEESGRSTPPLESGHEEDSASDADSIPDLSQEKGIRFHLKKKSRKKVETLLHQMFEGEINPDDDGVEDIIKTRSVTLDSVT